AFRRQAKKLHPDANKKDPRAAVKFAELNTAYELLGDDKKRKAFDAGEIDAEGKPRFRGFGGGGHPGFGGGGNFEGFTWGPGGVAPVGRGLRRRRVRSLRGHSERNDGRAWARRRRSARRFPGV